MRGVQPLLLLVSLSLLGWAPLAAAWRNGSQTNSLRPLSLHGPLSGQHALDARPPSSATVHVHVQEGLSPVKSLLSAEAEESEFKHEEAEVAITFFAIVLGAVLVVGGQVVPGMMVIYFGAQTGFSFFMKAIFSSAVVSRELGLRGVPAAFLVTAVQQLVTLVLFTVGIAALWLTPWRYTPKSLTTPNQRFNVVCFALSFAASIGFNNFSLSFISVSLNLTLRSCTPLACVLSQVVIDHFGLRAGGPAERIRPAELALVVGGVLCAVVAIFAKGEASNPESAHLGLGVFVCVLSVFGAAFNLVLATILGGKMELNTLDSALYSALPAAVALLPPALLYPHPVDWPGAEYLTDWSVIKIAWELSPRTLGLVAISGVFAALYNMFQYSLIQVLSADHTAFCGNFNKAATVILSLCLGLETLPEKPWSLVLLLAIFGNVAAFTGYSVLKASERKKQAAHKKDENGAKEPSLPLAVSEEGEAVQRKEPPSPMKAMRTSLEKKMALTPAPAA